jgi:hypothetical protein
MQPPNRLLAGPNSTQVGLRAGSYGRHRVCRSSAGSAVEEPTYRAGGRPLGVFAPPAEEADPTLWGECLDAAEAGEEVGHIEAWAYGRFRNKYRDRSKPLDPLAVDRQRPSQFLRDYFDTLDLQTNLSTPDESAGTPAADKQAFINDCGVCNKHGIRRVKEGVGMVVCRHSDITADDPPTSEVPDMLAAQFGIDTARTDEPVHATQLTIEEALT